MPKKKVVKSICPVCLDGKMLPLFRRNRKAQVLSQIIEIPCPRCKGKGSI